MKITVEFEEKDVKAGFLLVDKWGNKYMIVGSPKSYLFNVLSLETNILMYECVPSAAELVKFLNVYKLIPQNQTSL
jgi:hypothetical protein